MAAALAVVAIGFAGDPRLALGDRLDGDAGALKEVVDAPAQGGLRLLSITMTISNKLAAESRISAAASIARRTSRTPVPVLDDCDEG